MRFHSFLFLVFAILSVLSCNKSEDTPPEKGVSVALNNARKKTVSNIQYDVTFDIPSQKEQPIQGLVKVAFDLASKDSMLVLDFNADSLKKILVKSEGNEIEATRKNGHLIIAPEHLKKGRNELEIVFTAGDLSLNRSEDYLYTLFVPDRASTCFPLFDQPNLKAVYKLTLKTPAGWEAVANGALKSRKVEGDKSIYEFAPTKPVSSYLFAFAAGKFFKETKTIGGREMTMYYRENDTAKVSRNRDEVFALHARSLDWLEKYTGIPYPFGKFDFALIPSFQYGGMEHPGSVFYNESALFLDENPSVNKQLSRASVIAHESAHMWFGDLVTMDWFNDVWLKEVFANFMAAKIVHPGFPQINHKLRFLLAHYPNAYEIDRTAGTNPVLQDLSNLRNAGTLYGAIIYMKAPIVMRKLETMIGENLMQESLRDYLKTFSYKNARWDDLIGIIDKRTSQDLAAWSRVWVKTPGMPEYQSVEDANYKVILQQIKDTASGRVWEQPLTVKTRDTQAGRVVFPNGDGTGYGYFKMDSVSQNYFFTHYNEQDSIFSDPVFKGATLVNIWEGFLREPGRQPQDFVNNLLKILPKETDPLLIDYMLGNLQTSWWIFLSTDQRKAQQTDIENQIWSLLNATKDKGVKTSYFRAFKNLAFSGDGLKKLEMLWTGSLVVKDLILSEDDKISLAQELALKRPDGATQILEKQLSDTKNPDRKKKMQFVKPALNVNEAGRDAFFETLKKEENREKEAWVLEALGYLHHPLHQKSALKYLRPSLELLEEIQLTGDIFFPTRWLHSTFSGHSSKEAAEVVEVFLKEHPRYPYFLRNKILQETDMLRRSYPQPAGRGI